MVGAINATINLADEDGENFTGAANWFKKVPGDTAPVPVDKSELEAAIDEAEGLLAGAEEGEGPG